MKHPFISRPRLAVYYFLFWISALVGDILIRWLVYDANPGHAASEFFAFPFMFLIIGTPIWYVIKFSTIENNSVGRIIVSHIFAATIMVLIWLYLGMVIIKLINPELETWAINNIPNNILIGYMLYSVYVVFFYAVNYYEGFREKLQNEGKLKSLVKEAELHALKSQINPHFLFNSLNSISSLTITDPVRAQEMIINLSSLMRYSLRHNQREKVPFHEELKNNKLYLQIEKVRFGSKLNALFNIEEECLEYEVPGMILQPLYENAIKYGVYESIEKVDVITRAVCDDGMLKVTVSNNYDPDSITKKGEGIGLMNIRERLDIIYGDSAFMLVEDDKKEFKVTLAIPGD